MQKYNCDEVCQSFIQYFYNSWINNPNDLLDTIISQRTKLKYNNIVYEYTHIIILLLQLKSEGLDITVSKYEVVDSKSRQLYILVKGMIKNATFSQTFVLIHTSNKWNLINSILIIE